MVLEGQELGYNLTHQNGTVPNQFQHSLFLLWSALSLSFVRNVIGFVKQWHSGFKSLVIQCARIRGVEIPNKKHIETSMQYVHGVGQTTAQQILLNVGLENKITSEISEPELAKIHEELVGYMIERELVCC